MERIFIGDVQGCADELDEMIARAERRFGARFELWLVGDLVNRGPYNLRVLRTVREWMEQGRARCVLGNHDIALLRTALGLREPAPRDSISDVLEAPDLADWIGWLSRLPLVETGRLGAQSFAMVHGAVHPDWSLRKLERRAARAAARLAADPAGFLGAKVDEDRDLLDRLTRCRSVGVGGEWSSEVPSAQREAWHAVWSRRGHDYGVVYGHWALQGLHVAPGLRGLDTGCVHHGRGHDGVLTAWLPDSRRPRPFDVPDEGLWGVRARRRYYADENT
jgi:bis(5'-nucleosyl)-tetraphosphatase (symmetrical)